MPTVPPILVATLFCFPYLALAQSAVPLPPQVPAGIHFDKGLEYANPDGQHLKLDMARPIGTGRVLYPAVVYIHGGGFRAGTRENYDQAIVRLAARGYVAVTVSYRLAPTYPFPAAVFDVKAAVRWLRKNARRYQIDPGRIGATGASAGGHLAQFLGVTANVPRFEGTDNLGFSSAIACVVNYYGPSDFTKSYGKSVDAAEVLPLWLGGDLKTAFARHVEASPLYWVTPAAAPTLLLHGTADPYVAYEQAQWLWERLKAAQVDTELMTFAGAGHGFKEEDATRAEAALNAFFDRCLKKP